MSGAWRAAISAVGNGDSPRVAKSASTCIASRGGQAVAKMPSLQCSTNFHCRPPLTIRFAHRKFPARLVYGMKRYLPFVIVVGVALATFGSGAMLYRAKRPKIHNIPESQSVSANGDKQSA